MSEPTALSRPEAEWLRDECPDVFHMLRAIKGDGDSLRWLDAKGPALGLFTRAVAGDRHALTAFRATQPADLDDICGAIATFDRPSWLSEHSPDLHLLFEAIKGTDDALKRLKRKRAALARLAETVRVRYNDPQRGADETPLPPPSGSLEVPQGAAADVGCLIGELHLRQGEFARAVEAFSRSLESSPTADAYAGRARAYRALADHDERQARELASRD